MKSASAAKSPAPLLLVAMLVLPGGCRKAGEAQSAEDTAQQVRYPRLVASSSDLVGVWTVVGHHVPGISAMSDADAPARDGATVRTKTEAVSQGTTAPSRPMPRARDRFCPRNSTSRREV